MPSFFAHQVSAPDRNLHQVLHISYIVSSKELALIKSKNDVGYYFSKVFMADRRCNWCFRCFVHLSRLRYLDERLIGSCLIGCG